MSIRSEVAGYILAEISNIEAEYKILVLDNTTKKILDACTDTGAVFDKEVTSIEVLEKKRQPYGYMDAVYFIAPTKESVERVVEDFGTKRLYKKVHLLFTSKLCSELFHKLANSRVSGQITTFKELYVEIVAFESRGYQVDLFVQNSGGLKDPFGISENFVDSFAERLGCLCITLNEFPVIRYTAMEQSISRKIAEALFKFLTAYQEKEKTFSPKRNKTFLIVDRKTDLISPFLHEFTYQAMAHDLLPISSQNRYKHGDKTVVLDEDDSLMCSLRHKHIAACQAELSKMIAKFKQENKAAQNAEKTGGSQGRSLEEMKDVIADLPKYHEMKSAFSLHMSIAVECTRVFGEKKLDQFCGIEQTMAVGTNSEGTKQEIKLKDIIPFLTSSLLSEKDKERLLLLYSLSQVNIEAQDFDVTCQNISMKKEDSAAIKAVHRFAKGIKDFFEKVSTKKQAKKESGFFGFLNKGEAEEEYAFSRHRTLVRRIFEAYCRGDLNEDLFPYLNPAAKELVQGSDEKNLSLRKQRSETKPKATGQGLFLFVTGAVCYSELRDAYLVSEKMSSDCFIGGTSMQTPEVFCSEFFKTGFGG